MGYLEWSEPLRDDKKENSLGDSAGLE